MVKDVIWRAMLRAKIQSTKEQTGICFKKNRPDGMSLIPWEKDRCLTWDVTIADTFADSYIKHLAEAASAAPRERRQTKQRNMNIWHITLYLFQSPAKSLAPGALKVLNLLLTLVAKFRR